MRKSCTLRNGKIITKAKGSKVSSKATKVSSTTTKVTHYGSSTKTMIRQKVWEKHMEVIKEHTKASLVALDAGAEASAIASWRLQPGFKPSKVVLINNDKDQCIALKKVCKQAKVQHSDFFACLARLPEASVATIWYDGTAVHKDLDAFTKCVDMMVTRLVPGGNLFLTVSFRGVVVADHVKNLLLVLQDCLGHYPALNLYESNEEATHHKKKWMAHFETRVT